MGICYKAWSLKHKRVLDLGKQGGKFVWACGPPNHYAPGCKALTYTDVMEGLESAQEDHREDPGVFPEASVDHWPWRGILAWLSEVSGPVYLAGDHQDHPQPWKTEEGWRKDTLFGAAVGHVRGFVREDES
jgi:hypothetical protein